MKHNKKTLNQDDKARRQENNTKTNRSLALGDDTKPKSTDGTTLQPESHAARAVFNTPELLEAILVNLPIECLTRALRISKYCRQVTLGSLELRRILFFDPSPPTEFVEFDNRQLLEYPTARRKIIHQPNQNSYIVVKAHPLLVSLRNNFAFCAHSCQELPSGAAYGVVDGTMHMVSPSTLVFQPPPPKVKVFYRGHSFLLGRDGGVTFGDLAEGLRDLRTECQKKIDKLVKQPCTPWNRFWYADAMEALGGPPYPHSRCSFHYERHIPPPEPCVFLAAEGAISEDSQHVWMARKEMTFTGW